MSTPFDADAGTGQERIEPTDGPTFEGAWLYQFGHDLPSQTRKFDNGDYHRIEQDAAFHATSRVLRVRVRIRPPTSVPAGGTWTFKVTIDGSTHASVPMHAAGPGRTLADFAANVGPAVIGAGQRGLVFQLTFAGATGTGPFSAELPGVALDAIVEDTTVATPGVFNRNPEPGETRIGFSAPLVFDVYDTEGNTVDTSRTTVTFNGAVVYTAGAFVGAWASGSSTSSLAAANAVVFTLVPPAPLLPDTTYPIRVQSAVVGGPANALDTSWSFTTLDTTAPAVLSAMALDAQHVLVSFSKPMQQADPAVSTDTLDPAAYGLSLVSGAPAVTPAVSGVGPGASPSSAVLALVDPLTANAVYNVTVTGVDDALGNALAAPPANAGTFVWAGCPAPAGRDSSLWRLLPHVVRDQDTAGTGDLARFIACLQVIYDELLCDVDRWTDTLDPDVAAEEFLDAMLADLGNPFDTFVLDVTDKRRLVRLLIPLYRQKGTDPGVINAIRLFTGVEVTILVPSYMTTWTLGVSLLGSDTILGTTDLHVIYGFFVVSPVVLTDAQVAAIETIVAYMRRAPCHLLGIEQPTAPPPIPLHWELGLSELGTETLLH